MDYIHMISAQRMYGKNKLYYRLNSKQINANFTKIFLKLHILIIEIMYQVVPLVELEVGP